MVKACSINGCVSGYKKHRKIRASLDMKQSSLFRVPKDSTLLARWSSILKMNLKPNHYLCDFHFKEEDIVKSKKLNLANGDCMEFPLGRWQLLPNAVPINVLPRQYNSEFSENQENLHHRAAHFIDDDLFSMNSKVEVREPFQQLDNRLSIKRQLSSTSENESRSITKSRKIENPDNNNQDFILQEASIDDLSEQQSGSPQIIQETNIDSSMTFEDLSSFFMNIPPAWYYVNNENEWIFVHMDPFKFTEKFRVTINKDMSLKVSFEKRGKLDLNLRITCPAELSRLLKELSRAPVCNGTGIKAMSASARCRGIIVDNESYKRQRQSTRCTTCRILRHRLLSATRKCHATNIKYKSRKRLKSITKKCNRLQKKVICCSIFNSSRNSKLI